MSAWIWGFSSMAKTAAATGGLRYSPTRSRIFSTRSGSGEILKLSVRHGLSPNARQISRTVVWLIPCFLASSLVDQCEASGRFPLVLDCELLVAELDAGEFVRSLGAEDVVSADESPTFEAALQKLDEIVQKLEKGDLPLEQSLVLYEEGVRLSRLCHAKLEEAEGKIELLLKDARGDLVLDASGRPRKAPFGGAKE